MTAITQETLEKLKLCGQGTLTTQLFHRGYRQQVLVGLTPLNWQAGSFAGEAFLARRRGAARRRVVHLQRRCHQDPRDPGLLCGAGRQVAADE